MYFSAWLPNYCWWWLLQGYILVAFLTLTSGVNILSLFFSVCNDNKYLLTFIVFYPFYASQMSRYDILNTSLYHFFMKNFNLNYDFFLWSLFNLFAISKFAFSSHRNCFVFHFGFISTYDLWKSLYIWNYKIYVTFVGLEWLCIAPKELCFSCWRRRTVCYVQVHTRVTDTTAANTCEGTLP